MNKFVFLVLVIFAAIPSFAQLSLDTGNGKMVRYYYKMDDYFTGNRKLIRHLDTIIPVLFKELGNSRTCETENIADYTLELVISPAKINSRDFAPTKSSGKGQDYYNHITNYSVQASLILYKKSNIAVKVFDLIEPTSKFEYQTKHILRSSADRKIPYYEEVVNPANGVTSQVLRYRSDINGTTAENPLNYFKNHRITDPKEKDLLRQVELALFSLYLVKLPTTD